MKLPRLAEIGTIQRTHGVNGELQLIWTGSFDPEEQTLESVFLTIEGIPVPFFVESLRSKGDGSSIVTFEGITTKDQAQELINCKVYAPVKKTDGKGQPYSEDLIGYTVITPDGVKHGTITHVEDFSGNLVFQVRQDVGTHTLIPANPDFIRNVDEDGKTITMDIPEGLP